MPKIVKYDNKMNSLNFEKFTSNDFDFFFGVCHEMQGKGTNEVTLTFSQIAELVQYKETDKKRFIRDIERMYDKVEAIQYRREDSEEIVKFRLFGKFRLFKEKEEIIIRIDEEFVSLLNNLTQQFTLFELKQFIELSGKHTKTLFRLCKQWRVSGKTQVYTIKELKKIFDCENYENKNFTRLLDKSVKELKEKELFKGLNCEPQKAKKRGSPVTGYIFTFEAEKPKKKITDEQESVSSVQTFDEYIKAYQGDDKPTPIELKIAKDIAKGNKKKKKVNQFNDFPQDEYDYEELETLLLTTESNGQKML